jgi:hypothetical protein
MATTTADARPLPALRAARRFWNTPRRLVAIGVALTLLTVGLGAFVGGTVAGVRGGFTVIGDQAAPQVRTSADLYFALSDLDAQAANVLLVGTDPASAGDRTAALNLYEQRRVQADHDLDQAAADAGADPATQRTIATAIDRVGHYESLVAQSFLVNQQGHDPVGRPSAAALTLYRQATDSMRGTLPGVRQLIGRNHDVLDAAYADQRGRALGARVWLGVLGGALVACLVWLQVWLRRRLRRTVNPALVLASVAALVLTVGAIGVLSGAGEQLRVAKADAFDSIVALSQARAVSYDANADESRYLVDPGRAGQYQQAFLTKTQSLLNLDGAGLDRYDSAFAAALRAYAANHADIRFTGYLGTEMRNITFTGERAAAERVLANYQTYQRDDRRLRALATSGRRPAAIQFDIGTAPGQSDYAFNQFDSSLMALIGINQKAFDTAIHSGQDKVTGWSSVVPGLGVLLVVGLLLAGLWPRVAEYR